MKVGSLLWCHSFLTSEGVLYLYKSIICLTVEYCCHLCVSVPLDWVNLLNCFQWHICNTIDQDLASKSPITFVLNFWALTPLITFSVPQVCILKSFLLTWILVPSFCFSFPSVWIKLPQQFRNNDTKNEWFVCREEKEVNGLNSHNACRYVLYNGKKNYHHQHHHHYYYLIRINKKNQV